MCTHLHANFPSCMECCLTGKLVCPEKVYVSADFFVQKQALAAHDQERKEAEEAEKRLKAALTAKREPSSNNSRIASPALGAPSSASETSGKKASVTEPTTLEGVGSNVDVAKEETSRMPEVCAGLEK